MLQIKEIRKQYQTGGFIQKALDGVSLNLRENEFVAILGPSGSGKTTLLNIIGGLDRYDSGDLIINGISTKKYKDRDWDSYRNHTIGFVFQSYNLIPHQSVLANVELALTISGISKSERKQRAIEALQKVGLGQQLHKKPNQMSGGQMQRVAIARALVNDPDILLADEPTGALDSDTSVQVMELLKEVAKDRLVVMVTHNPELAEMYATRIVTLKDGQILSDTDPFCVDESLLTEAKHQNMGKSSMSFLTALSLSFNNLKTKKARTLLTAFAGSIGIIGIAAILSLSNGVSTYIQSIEENTLSEYPLQIQSSGMDFTSMMGEMTPQKHTVEEPNDTVRVSQMITNMLSKVEPNDLASLKVYLESGESGIESYVNALEYDYNVTPLIYRQEENGVRQVNPDKTFAALGMGSTAMESTNSMMSSMMSTNVFHKMPENTHLYQNQYEIKAGRWPANYHECVVVLTRNGNISDFMLYALGLRDSYELDEMIQKFLREESIDDLQTIGTYTYDDFLGISFKLVSASSTYAYDEEFGVWKDKSDDQVFMQEVVSQGEDLTIVGVVQPSEDANAAMLSSGIGYRADLTTHVIEKAANSPIVLHQLENPALNVLSGNSFGEDNQNKLNMESLFTLNTDVFSTMFNNLDIAQTMNSDAFNLSELLDLESIELNRPELPNISLDEAIGDIHLDLSEKETMQLLSYLLSEQMNVPASLTQDLQKEVNEIIQNNVDQFISYEQLTLFVRDLMQDYHPQPDLTEAELSESLLAYFNSKDVKEIIQTHEEIIKINADITISNRQLKNIVQSVIKDYQAQENITFDEYLHSEQGLQTLAQSFAQNINLKLLSPLFGNVISDYIKRVLAISNESFQQNEAQINQLVQTIQNQMARNIENMVTSIAQQMQNAFKFDANSLDNLIQMNMDQKELTELLRSLMTSTTASKENNLKKFGYAELKNPSSIDIYPKDFESKMEVMNILDHYNEQMEQNDQEDKVISYTDLVGTLMSSVTDIVQIISYVLVAFVAISLVVSSIMIGVITYISVLERKKEIGILRAIGASKNNISQVFNAETFIIGLLAGVIGIVMTLLLLIPGNALIHSLADSNEINAALPPVAAIVLIILSVVLTLLGGLIPSSKAAKSDPVSALRSE